MKFVELVVLEAPVEVLGLGTHLSDLLQLFLDVTPAAAGIGTEADGEDASSSKIETPATAREREQPFKLQKKTQVQHQEMLTQSQQQKNTKTVHDKTSGDRDSGVDGEDGSPNRRLRRSSAEWRQYRSSGHLRLVEALLQRAGEHSPCMDAVAMLLHTMTVDENLPLSGKSRW